jgi:hypothetical protein
MVDEVVYAWGYNEQTKHLFCTNPMVNLVNEMYALLINLRVTSELDVRIQCREDCSYWRIDGDRTR